MLIRKSAVAGQFYSQDKPGLEKEVKNFLSIRKKEKRDVKAAIVPHAGYYFSGKLAGEVISKIRDKKTFIILGVNHSSIGNKVALSLKDFETPLGIVKNNSGLVEKISAELKKLEIDSGVNEDSHKCEHSIEVELPFLQLSQKNFNIIPILLTNLSYYECMKIAKVLSEFLTNDVCFLVSSDFTHYGYNYGFMPFTSNIKENLYNLDKSIIQEILNLESKKIYERARKSTICGFLGITILAEIAKILGFKAELIDYYTSADVTGDWNTCVGYSGIIFE